MSDSNRWKWGIFSWYEGCTSCLLPLVVTLGAKRGMGGEETERERETEGGEERVRKWTLQSDLKFIFNQAQSSQTTMLLGAKRHNFTENQPQNRGLQSTRRNAAWTEANKQTSQPYCNSRKEQLSGGLNSASTFELRRNLYLIDEEVRCAAAVFKIWRLLYCGGETDARNDAECSRAAIDPPEHLPLMLVPLSRRSMPRVIDSRSQLTHDRQTHTLKRWDFCSALFRPLVGFDSVSAMGQRCSVIYYRVIITAIKLVF